MKKIGLLLSFMFIIFLLSCSQQKNNTFEIVETYSITSSNGSKSFLSVDLPISYGYQRIGEIKIENVDSYTFEQRDGYQKLFAELTGDGTEKVVKGNIIKWDRKLEW